jgi:LacI family transcriptional regulator
MAGKRVTSQDVARHAGVSRTTVSMVLNNVQGASISEETRHRVHEAAEKLGYVPDAAAQALVRRRAQTIGLILTRSPHHIASDVFLNQIMNGLIEAVQPLGLRLMLNIVEPEHQRKAYQDLVHAKRIDGLILSGPRLDDQALRALEEERFPMVLMGQLPGVSLCSVDVDNRAAAIQAVGHLIELGHTQIACITNAPISYTAATDRLAGYRETLEAAGLSYDQKLVRFGDFIPESGYTQMQSLLENVQPGEKPPFTAVFVASDIVALGVKAALRERGLQVPEDISLVGFDNVPLARFLDPPLTTIHLPALELARKASQMLVKLIKGEQPQPKNILLNTNLVVRESSSRRVG